MNAAMLGLGAMGFPIAQNLLKGGARLFAYNRSWEKTQRLAGFGAVPCQNIREAVSPCELVFTCLPNAAAVEQVMLSPGGVLESCAPDTAIVDLSSVSPETSRKLYGLAKERGLSYADAPVSGGVHGAEEGALTVMFGGDEDVYHRLLPTLRLFGKKILRIGPIGSGNAVKIVNNLLLGCNMAAVAEALALGRQMGLSLETMKEVIGGSSGNSYVFTAKMDSYILPKSYEGGFAADLQQKDLRLALDSGADQKVPMPMTAAAAQIYAAARSLGNGRKDISSIVEVWETLTGKVL